MGLIEGPHHIAWIHLNNTTFRPDLASLAKAKYTFVVLRDPFRRLVSCYLDKIVDKTPVAWQLHNASGHTLDLDSLTFRSFVDLIKSKLRTNEHWRPQVDFLVYKDYDDYFCVEELPVAIETLSTKISFDVMDARPFTKHGSERYELLDSAESPADMSVDRLSRMKRSGVIPTYDRFYDEHIAGTVRRLFEDDITNL